MTSSSSAKAPSAKASAPPGRRPARRAPRTDGEATRLRILETAGRLFAERGYADTTSKAICQAARTNMAAVNYHFGSRDGLYAAVLRETHRRLVSLDDLARLADGPLPPREKLARLIEGLVANVVDAEGWHARLWAREVLAPSPLLADVVQAEALPKFELIAGVLGRITGLPADDPALPRCMISLMAPCVMLLVANRVLPGPVQAVLKRPAQELAEHMKQFVFAGLDAVAAARRAAAGA